MFEGLYLPEVILMVCGVILFIILAVKLMKKGTSLASLVPLFLVSIVMIGWSGIQKVEYENGKFTIVTLSEEVSENPGNEEARAELETAIAKVERRAGLTGTSEADSVKSDTLLVLAKGNLALDRYQDAFDLASVAVTKQPDSPDAAILLKQSGIEVLQEKAPTVRPDSDNKTKLRLKEVTSVLEAQTDLSADDHVELSRAYKALGENELAKKRLHEARILDPDAPLPRSLRELDDYQPPPHR